MKTVKRILSVLLSVLMILSAVSCLGTVAFAADSDFTIVDGVLKGYNGPGGDVVVPDGVTVIGRNAFTVIFMTQINSIKLPDSVTSIEEEAFLMCTVKSLVIPDSVKTIGARAFLNCSNLESLVLPSGLTTIEYETFLHCSRLKSIAIPKGVTSIGNNAFENCSGLREITVGDKITSIGTDAFSSCGIHYYYTYCDCDLNTVKSMFGENVTQIPHKFVNNTCTGCGLEEFVIENGVLTKYNGKGGNIVIPDSVTEISSGVFSKNTTITGVTAPNVTTIGKGAFRECANLSSVELPKAVTIGDNAFYQCGILSAIDLPKAETIGQQAFYFCTNLTSANMPEVKTIAKKAFNCCSSLKTVSMPKVENVGEWAFYTDFALDNVYIPNATTIGERAFYQCYSIEHIYMTNATTLNRNAFGGMSALIDMTVSDKLKTVDSDAFSSGSFFFFNTVYVPCDSDLDAVEATLSPFNFKSFTSIPHNFVDGKCTICGKDEIDLDEYKTEKIDDVDKFIKSNVPAETKELQQFKSAVEEIKDSINAGTSVIDVDSAYDDALKLLDEFVVEKHMVMAKDGATVSKKLDVTKSTKYEIATVKIAEADGIRNGKWFVYWVDQDNNIVSSYSTYSFYVVEDRSLKPVYVSPDDYEGYRANAILVTDIVRADDNGDGTATLFAEHSASKAAVGNSILQHGVIYTTDAAQKDNLTVDNDNVNKTVAAKTNTSLSGLFKAVIDVEENDTVYAKSYMTDANGNTVYGSTQTLSIGKFTTSADSDFEVLGFDNALQQEEEIIVTADAPVEETAPSFMSVVMSILNAIMALIQSIIALF